jgi:hypothetical protein
VKFPLFIMNVFSLLQELCKESLINGIDIGPVFHFDKKVFKIVNRNE